MKYEIQVHFENQGQLAWKENIPDDVSDFLEHILDCSEYSALDEENNRWIAFRTKNVIAIMAIPNQVQDPIRRIYAPSERQEQENHQPQHSGNAQKWLPGEPSRCC